MPLSPKTITALGVVVLLMLLAASTSHAQTREEKVRGDREKVLAGGYWLYNDLEKGLSEAEGTGKPLLVVLRCIPCEECVKLDEDLMEQDPVLRPLLDQFVRVRIVGTNGLDLNLFQYDYDQSFAVFLMNADKTIYGRFGTRSHRTDWTSDVSIQGLAKAMDATLKLHANYPANRAEFAGKQGAKPLYAAPEKFPSLKEKYTSEINYKGNVVQSCIHCHQIGDAEKAVFRDASEAIPTKYLFPYPHPKILGLILDPSEMSTVKDVTAGSAADTAGLQPGDRIQRIESQIILSIADIQWVLHHADDEGELAVQVIREGEPKTVRLSLEQGWRNLDDLSWRVSSWPLRRMVAGGLVLEEATPEQRKQAGLEDSSKMALRVKFVGKYGAHAAGMKAGFRVDDLIVSYDGRDDLLRETDLLSYSASHRRPGDQVEVQILRGRQPMRLRLPMQK